ncbi:unnamed protein product [Rotaria socialis]|uniref:HTH psq-type domain-containing protein n=1 Tax=Rotaria socialis TaxID=392032 RepID=A0A820R332_9BILA|nr:unnamed protein product [Rotaria socialis]
MASTSGERCTLSIEQKLEILEALKSKKPDDVAKDFNIGYSTVKKIRKKAGHRKKYLSFWKKDPVSFYSSYSYDTPGIQQTKHICWVYKKSNENSGTVT